MIISSTLINLTPKRLVSLGEYLKRMGRRRRNVPNKFAARKRERKEQELNPQETPKTDNRTSYEDIVRENAVFDAYYKVQKVCPEEEWPQFMATLKENLPTAFRITGTKSEVEILTKIVKSQLFYDLLNVKTGDGEVKDGKDNGVEQENNDLEQEKIIDTKQENNDLKHEEVKETKQDSKNLQQEKIEDTKQDSKNLQQDEIEDKKQDSKDLQQEEIKPINLPWYPGGVAWQLRFTRMDIRRNEALYRLHNFLVAETAAGGVSRQETVSMIPPVVLQVEPHHKVLDMCASPGSKTAQLIEFLHADDKKMPTGFVMANDVDNSRCYMLVHQAKRLNSPCVLITNNDATVLPKIMITDPKNPQATKPMMFDRILCDVPCSGDGTLRKNPDIWLKWSPGNGNNLHGIQHRLLRRGLELLEEGGRLVYSTCSFNPVENEAVIHRMLKEAAGSVRLVNVSDLLPGLKFSKGMTSWKLASKDMVFYEKYEDVPERFQSMLRPEMFPPSPEDLDKYQLEKCIRVLPHQQDTGGFFVAALEKTSPLPWEKDPPAETEVEKNETVEEVKYLKIPPPQKRRRMGGYKEDPFVFFKENEDVFPCIKEFYQLRPDFDSTCLLTRCHVGKKKNLYLVSPIIKDVVQNNDRNIKIINTGVRAFVRCDNKNMACPFRLCQEALPSIKQYIGSRRRFSIPREDLILVLHYDAPLMSPHIMVFTEQTQENLMSFETGSCVLEYKDKESELQVSLVGWRGVNSLRAYTAASDTVHYLRLLGADYSKFDINKFKKADVTEPSEGPEEAADPADEPQTDQDNPQSPEHVETTEKSPPSSETDLNGDNASKTEKEQTNNK